MRVKGLISPRVDFAPVIFFQFVDVCLVFGGKLVALDLRVEVVVDDGVRLHGKRIPQARESATIFLRF